jgi:predicted transglutaminase-like cysteine proteinase
MFNLLKALIIAVSTLVGTNAAFAGTSMATGDFTSKPIGHVKFCESNNKKCQKNPAPTNVFQGDVMALLQEVTADVNHKVQPMIDTDIWGMNVEERWSYPVMKNGKLVGDCEDTVLLKRYLLFKAGIPAQDILITVVRQPDGSGHAVLTVRTNQGDLILDNLTDKVVHWDQTNYTFIKRQSIENSGIWVTIESQPDALTASVE